MTLWLDLFLLALLSCWLSNGSSLNLLNRSRSLGSSGLFGISLSTSSGSLSLCNSLSLGLLLISGGLGGTLGGEGLIGDALQDLSIVSEATAHKRVQVGERDATFDDRVGAVAGKFRPKTCKVGSCGSILQCLGSGSGLVVHLGESSNNEVKRGAFGVGHLDQGGVFFEEGGNSLRLAHQGESVLDSLGHIGLSEGRGCVLLRGKVRVALHVELAEGLEVIHLRFQGRNASYLLFLLSIWLKLTLALALLKVSVLVHLLAKVSEGLAFSIKEEIIELAEVELDRGTLLLFVLSLLSCLGTHGLVGFLG